MRNYSVEVTTEDSLLGGSDTVTHPVKAECMKTLEDAIVFMNYDELTSNYIEVASFDRRNKNRTIDVKVIS